VSTSKAPTRGTVIGAQFLRSLLVIRSRLCLAAVCFRGAVEAAEAVVETLAEVAAMATRHPANASY
jgi:hypothetical protein